jgi:hypothetical protein
MIVLQNCFQVQVLEDSLGLIFFCSHQEESRESIISFFKPKSPTIAQWLKPDGHEVEHVLGWDDQVLDGTRFSFPRLIMSKFHSRFVHLFKQVDSDKVTKQRLDRLRLELYSGIKASQSLVQNGQIEFMRRLYDEQNQDTEEAASALKKKHNNFTKAKGKYASKDVAQMNLDYDSENDSDEMDMCRINV